jgi:hypothetical protein
MVVDVVTAVSIRPATGLPPTPATRTALFVRARILRRAPNLVDLPGHDVPRCICQLMTASNNDEHFHA